MMSNNIPLNGMLPHIWGVSSFLAIIAIAIIFQHIVAVGIAYIICMIVGAGCYFIERS